MHGLFSKAEMCYPPKVVLIKAYSSLSRFKFLLNSLSQQRDQKYSLTWVTAYPYWFANERQECLGGFILHYSIFHVFFRYHTNI